MLRVFKQLREKITDWCLSVTPITIGELYHNNSPIVQDRYIPGTDTLKFIGEADLRDAYVKTPTGYAKVKKCLKTVEYDVWTIRTPSYALSGADEHIVMLINNKECYIKDLCIGDTIQTLTGPEPIVDIQKTNDVQHMYDLELVDDNHVYYTDGIVSHNSQTSAAYLLWYAMFHFEKTILIASNKNDNAMEMVYRIKFMYERVPHWLKPGLTEDGYNKHAIGFDNGSRIISTATSENSGRGLSISCIAGESLITVRNKLSGDILTIPIEEFTAIISTDNR